MKRKELRAYMKKQAGRCAAVVLGAAMLAGTWGLSPQPVFASEMEPAIAADAYGTEAVWWNARNAQDNNAVTDRPAPTDENETWEKWAIRFGTGFGASPTPPLLLNGKLYTAAGKKIYEVDRETGEVLRESEDLPMASSYGMNSPLYADGRIFVALSNSHICAVNLSDLSLAWTTAAYNPEGSSTSDPALLPAADARSVPVGQMVTPLSYVKIGDTGYVYTGTRTNAGGDFLCVTTDDSDVTVNEAGAKLKALTWHFNPKEEDAENLAAHDCTAAGFYWSGAYASEKFIAFGTDNGTAAKDTADCTPFYTLNPLTGEIIDAVYGIKGAVRSTTVYRDGALYFVSKEAVLYKVPVDEDGHLGELSCIELQSRGASASSATPVLYGGRIYVSASGKGTKLSADGGHGIFVVKDGDSLRASSFLYKIPVPGYPQMGALLTDAYAGIDFDEDGAADGRVYLYFTYNAYPGGIFYTWDAPGLTRPTNLSGEQAKLFVPESDKQQYCISSIVADTDGTLYYKNDSGYLFAVGANVATLKDLQVKDSSGNVLELNQEFQSKLSQYAVTVDAETEAVELSLTPAVGVTVRVNGEEVNTEEAVRIPLAERDNRISIKTEKGGQSRTYQLAVKFAGADASLSALASTTNNIMPNDSNTRLISPVFDPEVTDYAFDWFGMETSMMNLFLKATSDKSVVAVYPVENVDETRVQSNGTIQSVKATGVTDTSEYALRIPVYPADPKRDVVVRIVVTAEDGLTTREYTATFNRRVLVQTVELSEIDLQLKAGETHALSAQVFPDEASDHSITWASSDEAVATVDEEGLVTAIGKGTAVITAQSGDEAKAECKVTVLSDAPEVTPQPAKPAKTVVKKAKNPMTVKTKLLKVKAGKKKTFKAAKAFVVKKAAGKVTYKKTKGNAKILVAANGKITVKKGLKKGKTYVIRVTVTAAGDASHRKGVKKNLKLKIKIT